ncbi:MAG: ATP-grasp domain-containing protein [Pseudomonadota bacterium]
MSVVAARSLSARGVSVISCDCVDFTAASFSKFTDDSFVHANPDEDLEDYLDSLVKEIERRKPASGEPYVLIPMFQDTRLLAEHRSVFDGLITLAAPPFDAINRVDPKHRLLKTLGDLNIPAPKTWHPASISDVEDAVTAVTLPAVLKAVDEVGGRGVEFFDDRDQLQERTLQRCTREMPPPIIQEAIEGEDYCLCVLYHGGERLTQMAYKNVHTMPSNGGAGAMRETVDDSVFLSSADAIMAAVGWTGIAEIDFRWTGNPMDAPQLIEINPRFWAGLFHSVESGIDFPWSVYELATTGHLSETPGADVGKRTKVPAMWIAGAVAEAFEQEGPGADAWQKMMHRLRDREFVSAFKQLRGLFVGANSFQDAVRAISQSLRQAKGATSEIDMQDAAVCLGVFFALSSIARYGRLPDELKS